MGTGIGNGIRIGYGVITKLGGTIGNTSLLVSFATVGLADFPPSPYCGLWNADCRSDFKVKSTVRWKSSLIGIWLVGGVTTWLGRCHIGYLAGNWNLPNWSTRSVPVRWVLPFFEAIKLSASPLGATFSPTWHSLARLTKLRASSIGGLSWWLAEDLLQLVFHNSGVINSCWVLVVLLLLLLLEAALERPLATSIEVDGLWMTPSEMASEQNRCILYWFRHLSVQNWSWRWPSLKSTQVTVWRTCLHQSQILMRFQSYKSNN